MRLQVYPLQLDVSRLAVLDQQRRYRPTTRYDTAHSRYAATSNRARVVRCGLAIRSFSGADSKGGPLGGPRVRIRPPGRLGLVADSNLYRWSSAGWATGGSPA